ncbi:hypothetical protein D3C75_658930 [compost metagenome]
MNRPDSLADMHLRALIAALAECAEEQRPQGRRYLAVSGPLRVQLGFILLLPVQIAPPLQQCLAVRIGQYDFPLDIKGEDSIAHAAQYTGQMPLLVIQAADVLFQLFSHMIEGGGQLADLVAGNQRQSRSVFPPADIIRRFNHLLHRLGNLGEQEQSEERCKRKSDHTDISEQAFDRPGIGEVAVDVGQQEQPQCDKHDSNQTDDRDPQLSDKTSPELHLFRYL